MINSAGGEARLPCAAWIDPSVPGVPKLTDYHSPLAVRNHTVPACVNRPTQIASWMSAGPTDARLFGGPEIIIAGYAQLAPAFQQPNSY